MRKIYLFQLAGLYFLTTSSGANAQSINYDEYKSLFGEPVTISANGTPQRLSDVTLNMEIITSEEIEHMGARSIPEILRFVPGLSVRQYSYGQTEVSIRGYNQPSAERILVLVDGRQVYVDAYGQTVWDNIPVEISEIKQIEIIKGPNNALFGFNAVSGVINIITVNPMYEEKRELTNRVSIGSESMAEATGVYTVKKDDYAVKFSGGAYEFDDDADYFTNAKGSKKRSASVDGHYRISDNTEAKLVVSRNRNDRNEVIVNKYLANTEYKTDSIHGEILSDSNYGLIRATAYINDTDASYFNGDIEDENDIFVANISDTFELGTSHVFRVGAEYREARNIYLPVENADLGYQIFSANTLWSWRVDDKLNTTFALRYDHFELSPEGDNVNSQFAGFPLAMLGFTSDDYNRTKDEYSFNIGASYHLTDIDKLKASIARGVDLPSFTDFGLQSYDDVGDIKYIGNPFIDTSTVMNYEVDYERRMAQINGKFTTAVFYQQTKDMQSMIADETTNAGTLYVLSGNVGDSFMWGAELGLDGKFNDKWHWSANYTFTKIEDDLDNNTAGVYYSPTDYEDTNSEHTINLQLGYTTGKWFADGGIQYASSFDDFVLSSDRKSFEKEHVAAGFTLNANVSYKMNDLVTMSVTGQNLFGEERQSAQGAVGPLVWTSMKVDF